MVQISDAAHPRAVPSGRSGLPRPGAAQRSDRGALAVIARARVRSHPPQDGSAQARERGRPARARARHCSRASPRCATSTRVLRVQQSKSVTIETLA
jgi:hypothetical protein